MIAKAPTVPRWLIDDTAGVTEAQMFVAHTQLPRFFGEIVPGDEAPLEGIELSGLPQGEVVTRIVWIDDPIFDADELIPSLASALSHHWSIRERSE